MVSGITENLNDIWGTSSDNIYAVGENGTVLHYDGDNWLAMNSGVSDIITKIIGFSNNEIYALMQDSQFGNFNSTVLKYDGNSWSTFYEPAFQASDIWGSSGSNLYVVGKDGSGGVLMHFNGSTWTEEFNSFPDFSDLSSIHGISSNEIYTISYDAGRVYHWKDCSTNGTYSWNWTSSPYSGSLEAEVWAAETNNAFAMFDNQVYHFTGDLQNGQCTQEIWNSTTGIGTAHLKSIWGLTADNVFVCGYKDRLDGNGFGSFIATFDGQTWQEMTTQTDAQNGMTVNGIWGIDSTHLYAVGDNGNILQLGGEVITTIVVNTAGDEHDLNPGDGIGDIGGAQINGNPPCTLRAALEESNANEETIKIIFDIPGNTPHIIIPNSEYPVILNKVVIDGGTNQIYIDGSNAGENANGFTINLDGRKSEIKYLSIYGFKGHGILLTSTFENIIYGCKIGTDDNNTKGIGNGGDGIHILSSHSNQIGGDLINKKNVISGNKGNGITITGDIADINIIEGNYIGTNIGGNAALPNEKNGILLEAQASENTIRKNLISGNVINGVSIIGDEINETKTNELQGNMIGTNYNGTNSLGNQQNGVYIENGLTNTVGGDTPEERNVISGNGANGVLIIGNHSVGNAVSGNNIGTSLDGSSAIGNWNDGVRVENAFSNHIGSIIEEPGSGFGNIISGNHGGGVFIIGTDATENTVEGNIIGLKSGGLEQLENEENGIVIENSSNNIIGGSSFIYRNIISGHTFSNSSSGISINGYNATGNIVKANYIGLSLDGLTPISNNIGIDIFQSDENFIGGNFDSERNVISGNNSVQIKLTNAIENEIKGNIIGLNKDGQSLNIHSYGISLLNSSFNYIGNSDFAFRNVISGNNFGIYIKGGSNNIITANYIGVNLEGNEARSNIVGVRITKSLNNVVGGNNTKDGNIIAGGESGVELVNEAEVFGVTKTLGNKVINNIFGADKSLLIQIPIETGVYNYNAESVIEGNYMRFNNTGVFIETSRKVDLNSNVIEGNNIGINIDFSTNISIIKNWIVQNNIGINSTNSNKLVIENNTIEDQTGNSSSIHLNNSYAEIKSNSISGDAGDAIKLVDSADAVVNYNNIFDNSGYGLKNTSSFITVDAQNNWWGDASGPGGAGSGNGDLVSESVDFNNWLSEMISLTISVSEDTSFTAIGLKDSVICFLHNFLYPNDEINLTIEDELGWLQGETNFSVPLDSLLGGRSVINFTIPPDVSAGTKNLVRINAVSQTNNTQSKADSFYVQAYEQMLSSMFVSPDSVEIAPGDSIQFIAYGFDQFDNPMSFSVQWSSDGGSINNEGWFYAPNQMGDYTVEAKDQLTNLTSTAVVIVSGIVGVKEESSQLPTEYNLYQNYPNPFNPSTTIRYSIPFTSKVNIHIFNILGELVTRLIDEVKVAGYYEVNWNASNLSSGVYIYLLQAESPDHQDNFKNVKKMILLK